MKTGAFGKLGRRARFGGLMLGVVLGVVALAAADLPEDPAVDTILLVNRDRPDSVRLGEYYADHRGIPRENLIALTLPDAETISWKVFVDRIWEPLQTELIRRGWIEGSLGSERDPMGRRTLQIRGHHIEFLVPFRGVPLRIEQDDSRVLPRVDQPNVGELAVIQAAVDSELALLVRANPPATGYITNSLYRNRSPSAAERQSLVRVSRLDGPSEESVRAMIDGALQIEERGLIGRAYVDTGGPHPLGDSWLLAAAERLRAVGFDVTVDAGQDPFPARARFDAPAIYLGWYNADLNGPMALPGFHFPAGALAFPIHSFSAETLHSTEKGWSGPLVARGVSATVGNVYEPFLELSHNLNLLMEALFRGDNFGEAAAYALPALSWEAIAIGDPLYRPFAVGLDEQVKAIDTLTAREAGYVAIRANLASPDSESGDFGLPELEELFRARPSLSLGIFLAQNGRVTGQSSGIPADWSWVREDRPLTADEAGLVTELARELDSRLPDVSRELRRRLSAGSVEP